MTYKTPANKRQWLKDHRDRKRTFVRACKVERGGCRDCGETNPIVLEFHHVNPAEKNPKLRGSKLRGSILLLGYEELIAEMEKCIVLCANCHRLEEHRKRQNP